MKLLGLMKKEFHRFFHDPRLVISMLLPGVFIFVLYTFMGSVLHSEEARELRVYRAGESVCTTVIEQVIAENGDKIEWLLLENEEEARAEVEEGTATAILKFTENFDSSLGNGAGVNIIYDSASEDGSYFYAIATSVFHKVGMLFDVTAETVKDSSQMGVDLMTGLLPFVFVCFVFTACMSVTLESVAGEKERGTLATVLVTSAKRSDVALGKVLALSCISMIGALSSFLGLAGSMPKLMGFSLEFLGGYSAWSYLLLLPPILCAVPLIVAAIATVSTLSRSVKEASAYTSVFMVVMMVVSLVTAFVPHIGDWVVAIPVLNAIVGMQGILAGELPVWQCLVGAGLNVLYTAVLVLLIAKMLTSERIMFGR